MNAIGNHWKAGRADQSCIATQQCLRDEGTAGRRKYVTQCVGRAVVEDVQGRRCNIDKGPPSDRFQHGWGKGFPGAGYASADYIHAEIKGIDEIGQYDTQSMAYFLKNLAGRF